MLAFGRGAMVWYEGLEEVRHDIGRLPQGRAELVNLRECRLVWYGGGERPAMVERLGEGQSRFIMEAF